MSLGTITYSQMVDLVKNWIKTNCTNISNFGSIPSCFKSGYSVSGKCSHPNGCPSEGRGVYDKYTITISGNIVSEVATSTVDSQMSSFWSTYCGSLNVNLNITAENYIAFMQDMVSFCSGRVFMAVSEYSANKYLIYNSGNTTYSNYVTLSSTQKEYRFVTATDVAYDARGILYNIINAVNQTIRLYPTRYSTTIA